MKIAAKNDIRNNGKTQTHTLWMQQHTLPCSIVNFVSIRNWLVNKRQRRGLNADFIAKPSVYAHKICLRHKIGTLEKLVLSRIFQNELSLLKLIL